MSEALLRALAGLLIGAVIGSFLATVLARRGRAESAWPVGRSRCDLCGSRLGPTDLVPLASYLLRRGRCRHCGGSISFRHPAVETAAAALGLASFLLAGWTAGAVAALLGWTLLLLSMVDLEEMRLPDPLTLSLAGLGLLLSVLQGRIMPPLGLPEPASALAAAAVGWAALAGLALLYHRLRGRQGLGMGDAKLAAAAGAWLGLADLPAYFLFAGLLGIAHAVVLGALRDPGRPIPFGPALGAALWLLFVTG